MSADDEVSRWVRHIVDLLGERPDAWDGAQIVEGTLGAIQIRLCEPYLGFDPSDPNVSDDRFGKELIRVREEHPEVAIAYGDAVLAVLNELSRWTDRMLPDDDDIEVPA